MNKEESDIEIVESFGDTIVKYNSEIAIDISELVIDELFEDSPLKELPFVKIVYSI